MTYTSELFLESKDTVYANQLNFSSVSYSCSEIQVAARCIKQVMLIYAYMCVSIYWSLCILCVFTGVCFIKSEN